MPAHRGRTGTRGRDRPWRALLRWTRVLPAPSGECHGAGRNVRGRGRPPASLRLRTASGPKRRGRGTQAAASPDGGQGGAFGGQAAFRYAGGRGRGGPPARGGAGEAAPKWGSGSAGFAERIHPVSLRHREVGPFVEVVAHARDVDRIGGADLPPIAHPDARDRLRGDVLEPAAEPPLDEHHRAVQAARELDGVERAKPQIGGNHPLLSGLTERPHVPEHRTLRDVRPSALVARIDRGLRPAHASRQVHERHPALNVARFGEADLDPSLTTGERLRRVPRLLVVVARTWSPCSRKAYSMDSKGSPVSPRRSSCAKTSPIRMAASTRRARQSSSTNSRMRSSASGPPRTSTQCSSCRSARRTSTSPSRSIQPPSSIAAHHSATIRSTFARPPLSSHSVASRPYAPTRASAMAQVSFVFVVMSRSFWKSRSGSARRLAPRPRGNALDRRDHLLRDHSGVGDQTHPTHPEATLQALSHLVERGDVGGVARPHLAAHRDTVPVNHHPQHHLFAIATVVLALAVLAEGVATVSGEEQRGGVEEHQVERAEQVAASSEQLLLDEVFDAPRRGGIGLACCIARSFVTDFSVYF